MRRREYPASPRAVRVARKERSLILASSCGQDRHGWRSRLLERSRRIWVAWPPGCGWNVALHATGWSSTGKTDDGWIVSGVMSGDAWCPACGIRASRRGEAGAQGGTVAKSRSWLYLADVWRSPAADRGSAWPQNASGHRPGPRACPHGRRSASRNPPRLPSWCQAWMTGAGARAAPTGRSWWTSSDARFWTSCRTARRFQRLPG